MKKILVLILALVLAISLVACTTETVNNEENNDENIETPVETPVETPDDSVEESVEVSFPAEAMTYAEFTAAELQAPVTVETYVQAKQSWWDNKATVYTQNDEGAYFLYEMACSEEDYALLVPGTKIRVQGYKAEWAGEVEIVDATFSILEGEYIAEATDVTALLGTDELVLHQNKYVSFDDMVVENIEFKNGGGDDIYVTVSKDGSSYSFCVEVYLTGTETEVYQTVSSLVTGDLIDIEGFLYWYEGVNTHITNVARADM